MLDIEKVIRYFSFFTDLDGEELERCRGLCEGGLARIARRLRPECAEAQGEDAERLCMAAAAGAYADYAMLRGGGANATDELRVGDITLKTGSAGTGIRDEDAIRDHFLANAADLLLPAYMPLTGVEA